MTMMWWCKRQLDQVLGQLGQLVGGEALADLEHHLQPEGEALGSKRSSSPGRALCQTSSSKTRHSWSTVASATSSPGVLEPDVVDQAHERRRRQRLDALTRAGSSRMRGDQSSRVRLRSRSQGLGHCATVREPFRRKKRVAYRQRTRFVRLLWCLRGAEPAARYPTVRAITGGWSAAT
jgi:hypothetical protein